MHTVYNKRHDAIPLLSQLGRLRAMQCARAVGIVLPSKVDQLPNLLFPLQNEDITGTSSVLQDNYNVGAMQTLCAKRLEKGALFKLLQTSRRTSRVI